MCSKLNAQYLRCLLCHSNRISVIYETSEGAPGQVDQRLNGASSNSFMLITQKQYGWTLVKNRKFTFSLF